MSNIEEFKKLYNFEFEEIKAKNYKEIEKKYLASYKEGKEKGFTPVFLVLDDVLLEKFEKLADSLYKNIQWYFWWD